MTIEQIEARKIELQNETKTASEERVAEIEAEAEKLEVEERAIIERAEAEKAEEARALAEAAEAKNVERPEEKDEKERRKTMNVNSAEYRTAFLKDLMGQELTADERSAYVGTTANTSAVLPTTMINKIWDFISEKHSIFGDITIYRTGTIIDVVKHTAITQGDATNVNENAENDDETNTFAKVTLSGKDFSKHIEITYALAKMSIDGFEDYLVNEIGSRLANALAADVISTIKSGVNSDNKIDTADALKLGWADVTGIASVLKYADSMTWYMNRATLYGYLASMADSTGRPIFQPTAQAGIEGYLLGAPVKIEEALSDKEILVGDPTKYVENVVSDIMVERDKDIKKHKEIFAGYCRASGALLNDKSFALLTIKNS